MKKFFEQSPAIRWKDDRLELLDQRILPARHEFLPLDDVESVADAIKDMVVRGAPAIGITAAYGVVLAARKRYAESPENWTQLIGKDLDCLAASRPTAVNLFWAIENMRKAIDGCQGGDPVPGLLELAMQIHENDINANRTMGEFGADLIAQHCKDRG
ncbi:MAG: S-methyl-5-thioribose-1-phosphate isomerase, partial [Gammaproteobacteria bacterium]|nr:S-methyl-5-thioribose-1-phosphate isomerase [Gammaproteobacteria bacterium]